MSWVVDTVNLVAFAATAIVLLIGHTVADHTLGQTDHQAAHKADAGWPGWRANLAHVLRYHLVLGLLAFAAWSALPLRWSLTGVLVAAAWSVLTHTVLDRRWPVVWLLNHTGKREFANGAGGLPGVYLADQALHQLSLGIAAVFLTVLH